MSGQNQTIDDMGDWVELYGGAKFSFSGEHDLSGYDIRAFAWNLCQVSRYRGASKRVISVGEHSIHVARICRKLATYMPAPEGMTHSEFKDKAALYGLFHDAAEIVTSDMPRPLKIRMKRAGGPAMQVWEDIERLADMTLFEHFGLEYPMPAAIENIVKKADNISLATEAKHHMVMRHPWGAMPEPDKDYTGGSDNYATMVYVAKFAELYEHWMGLAAEKVASVHAASDYGNSHWVNMSVLNSVFVGGAGGSGGRSGVIAGGSGVQSKATYRQHIAKGGGGGKTTAAITKKMNEIYQNILTEGGMRPGHINGTEPNTIIIDEAHILGNNDNSITSDELDKKIKAAIEPKTQTYNAPSIIKELFGKK